MKDRSSIASYRYENAQGGHALAYLLPALMSELKTRRKAISTRPAQLFELVCGNGSVAVLLARAGWQVRGVHPSSEGMAEARTAYPDIDLAEGFAFDDVATKSGRFAVVTSLEVVEHVYAPRDFARTLFDLVELGGTAIVSSPYQG